MGCITNKQTNKWSNKMLSHSFIQWISPNEALRGTPAALICVVCEHSGLAQSKRHGRMSGTTGGKRSYTVLIVFNEHPADSRAASRDVPVLLL